VLLRVIDPRSSARAGKPDHFRTISAPPGAFAVVQFCRQQAKPRTPLALTIGHSAGALLPKPDGITVLTFKEPTPLQSKNLTINFTDPDETLD